MNAGAKSGAVAAALFLGMAAPASACLNDRDTGATERQFRSNYPIPDANPPYEGGTTNPSSWRTA